MVDSSAVLVKVSTNPQRHCPTAYQNRYAFKFRVPMNWSEIIDIAVAIAALVGMFLGVFNFITERRKQKPKLKVAPKAVSSAGHLPDGRESVIYSSENFRLSGTPDGIAIEVLNLSLFPITISEVGFHTPKREQRMAVPMPIILDDGKWPRRLESREKVIVHIDLVSLLESEDLHLVKGVYARTDCGFYSRGNSKALSSLLRQVV